MKTLWLAFTLIVPASAQTYVIAGTVTDVAHGRPLERARVVLSGSGTPSLVLTRSDGRFLFNVPAGKYELDADRDGWRVRFGNPEPTAGFGSAVIAGSGQDTGNLNFRWYAPAAIFGKVVDEQGEPIRDAKVQLIRDGVVGGRRRMLSVTTTQTDDRGAYRFGPIPAGTYYVAANGRPWYDRAANSILPIGARKGASAYPPTYYPGATDARDAGVVAVQPGGAVEANIPLRAAAGATVTIHCTGAGFKDDRCPGVPSFVLHGIGGVEMNTSQEYDFPNAQFYSVAPGRYTVQTAVPGKVGYRTVDVGAGEFTFDLAMQAPARISGTVTIPHPLPPGAHEFVGLDNEISGVATGYEIKPDGTFASFLAGERLRPRLYGSVPLLISQMTVDGKPIEDGVIARSDITDVRLTILATDEVGRMKGFAMTGDRPSPAVLVVLAPVEDSPNPLRYRGFQTESDGSFDLTGVLAGDYLVFAVDRLDLEYTNPEVIRAYLASAIPLHIGSHTVVEQRVPVSPVQGK